MFNCLIFNSYFAQKMLMRQQPVAMAEDPWGSHKPDDNKKPSQDSNQKPVNQPPDLEELFAKILGFGGKGGNNRGAGQKKPADFQFDGRVAMLASAVVFSMWLGLGIYTVKERENGIETFLGKYTETTKSGLNWHVPFPLGSVEVVDVESIATMRIGEFKTQKGTISTQDQRVGQMLTKDENIVEIGAAVQYRIADAKAFRFNAADPVDVLSDVVTSAIREVVGANTVDAVLTDRRNEWPQEARKIIVETLKKYNLGIEIVAFELQDARVPAEVQDAFEDAVRAREDEERLRLQAEAFANERLPIARGHAEKLLQASRAYAVTSIAKAEAEATRFDALLEAYQKDKEAMRQRLYIETMNTVYARNRKLVLDGESQPIINFAEQSNPVAKIVVAQEKVETSATVSSAPAEKAAAAPAKEASNATSESKETATPASTEENERARARSRRR